MSLSTMTMTTTVTIRPRILRMVIPFSCERMMLTQNRPCAT